MKKIDRRQFLKGSLAASTGLIAASSLTNSAWAQIRGANEDVRVAIAGINSKGAAHINDFRKIPGVRLVAICDPDENILAREVKKLAEHPKNPQKVDTYIDIRKLLDNKDIDAIAIATPNHWHSLMTIWACQAGKDVYVEKPISHNIFEGQKAIQAARKYKRIVQTGTQNRSDTGLIPTMQYIHQGKLGAIKYINVLCFRRRVGIGKVSGPQPIPPHIDYDLWTGPAPLEPLMRKNLHYDWHWQWATGNADIGNQGVHEIDLALWAIQADKLPKRVVSAGGRFGFDNDDGQTQNTLISVLDYQPAPIICEARNLPLNKNMPGVMAHHRGIRVGVVIQCENGYFAGGRGGGWIYDNDGKKLKQFPGDGGGTHQKNFIDAVRTRNPADLKADIAKGHLCAAACHLMNTSYRLGQKIAPEEAEKAFLHQKPALEAWKRTTQHLFDNWIDLQKEGITLGPSLDFDPENEKFIEKSTYGPGKWANQMITRNYRKPFVVPEKV